MLKLLVWIILYKGEEKMVEREVREERFEKLLKDLEEYRGATINNLHSDIAKYRPSYYSLVLKKDLIIFQSDSARIDLTVDDVSGYDKMEIQTPSYTSTLFEIYLTSTTPNASPKFVVGFYDKN